MDAETVTIKVDIPCPKCGGARRQGGHACLECAGTGTKRKTIGLEDLNRLLRSLPKVDD